MLVPVAPKTIANRDPVLLPQCYIERESFIPPERDVHQPVEILVWATGLRPSSLSSVANTSNRCSTALLLLKSLSCQFAVKSGGHAAFTGASNIQGGVTIDLVNMNEITVWKDRTQTSIGPGNRWSDIYSKLDPLGLSVIGGRVSDIGIGGLTTGGGISFFSGRYGFACDNVNNYQVRPISSLDACSEFVSPRADLSQVAFADGTIRDVNLKTYADLFWALRGGGNNFGIVTRFDLNTFPQGDLWGGNVYWSYDNSAALLQALEDFNNNHATDLYGAVILAYGYIPAQDTFLIVSQLEYGKPVVNPPILQNFTKVPSIGGTMRISNLTGLTEELFGPPGFR